MALKRRAGFSPEDLAFFERHQGGSGNVWLVEVNRENGRSETAVFSSQQKATDWLDSLDEYDRALCVPFIVDEPGYGNDVVN